MKKDKQLKVIPLIPSLNPDMNLIEYIDQLIKIGFKKIIIINDGSSKKYDNIFQLIENKKECILLKHAINQGKGRALKTGFNYYLNNFSDYDGIVTADADGQHSAKDTLNIAEILSKNPNHLVLGTRNFNEEIVPFKSKAGNKITSVIFRLLYGKKISDTQTGLRGVGNMFMKTCLNLSGERYEYEINMLISAVKNKVVIDEPFIETIYLNDNKGSHFNPIKDSIKIYKVLFQEFFKFVFSGLFSFIIDILLFKLFVSTIFLPLNNTYCILFGTVLARIISSLINYTLNKNVVFNSNGKNLIIKYYTLCVIQMLISGLLVSLLFNFGLFSKTICKIIIDIILFFISYNIQKNIIFRK